MSGSRIYGQLTEAHKIIIFPQLFISCLNSLVCRNQNEDNWSEPFCGECRETGVQLIDKHSENNGQSLFSQRRC